MRASTDWFRDCGWGVFTHYLGGDGMSAAEWDERVSNFDVDGLADQLSEVQAPYYFITIGQNCGHYCAPNTAYDGYVGKPGFCSERDLIADLYEALNPRGIELLVYLPAGAPAADHGAAERLGWEWGYEGGWPEGHSVRTGKRLAAFQQRWEAVISEWSQRWGTKVRGWWIDGCYFADEMYRYPEPPNFESLAAALKAGNPDSIIAFNPGVRTPVISMTEYEDYTAGEVSRALPTCPGRWVDGAQYQILSYLGESWCKGDAPRFPDELVIGYTRHLNEHEGVVTWDVPIKPSGLIPGPFAAQLRALGEGLANHDNSSVTS